uniref:Transposase n=1 Tax=Strongyloides venezuelensis TaxID=75913 RepID=A0A0K0FQ32_STRVS
MFQHASSLAGGLATSINGYTTIRDRKQTDSLRNSNLAKQWSKHQGKLMKHLVKCLLKNVSYNVGFSNFFSRSFFWHALMPEWLMGQIRNLLGFARVGSNPTQGDIHYYY